MYDKKVKEREENQKKLQELNLLGSALILISGFIFLYIAFMDNDLDVELAFN